MGMSRFLRSVVFWSISFYFLSSCASQKSSSQTVNSLRLIGEFDLPHRMQFQGTTVGGLSGIDYNAKDDVYYIICDDRSDINPARFYTAKIDLGRKGIDTVQLLSATTLLRQDGLPFPNKLKDSFHVPDPEAIRYYPPSRSLLWSSEGERIVRKDKVILTNPAIYSMSIDGRVVDTFPIPLNMRMSREQMGPRQNGVFEGLSFSPDYRSLFVSLEEPLYQDGPKAGLYDTAGWVRIIRYDVATHQPMAQYAYQIDPVVQEPISEGLFIVNGVPDILAINDHQLLVTERSFSTGRLTCNVRIYLADLKEAENIAGVASLEAQPAKSPVKKTLLFNMDRLGRWVDNVEGATFGPRLPNGKRSLILVTDDNFSPLERTQFFLFEIN